MPSGNRKMLGVHPEPIKQCSKVTWRVDKDVWDGG